MDKNQAMIDYLINCPAIRDNPLFFNFVNGKPDNKQLITLGNNKILDKKYIDGSILKQYTMTMIDFKSVVYNAIVKTPGYSNENVDEMFDVQKIMDWVTEQNKLQNFPNFGTDCRVESIGTVTDNPNLNGVDTHTSPGTAKYAFSIIVIYLDLTDCIWKD